MQARSYNHDDDVDSFVLSSRRGAAAQQHVGARNLCMNTHAQQAVSARVRSIYLGRGRSLRFCVCMKDCAVVLGTVMRTNVVKLS